jgi:hypothetical protein
VEHGTLIWSSKSQTVFNQYRNVVGLPVVQVSEHDQLVKSLAYQSGTEILGINAVPIG